MGESQSTLRQEELLKRIVTDPAICPGKPVIRGLHYPVETLLELMASGMSSEEILQDYLDLEQEDLLACLLFALLVTRTKRVERFAR